MAKLKWDAQVRMKQSKLKASGQETNRANTVMLMMEEIISKGVLDIDLRFQALKKGEEFEVKFSKERMKNSLLKTYIRRSTRLTLNF